MLAGIRLRICVGAGFEISSTLDALNPLSGWWFWEPESITTNYFIEDYSLKIQDPKMYANTLITDENNDLIYLRGIVLKLCYSTKRHVQDMIKNLATYDKVVMKSGSKIRIWVLGFRVRFG